MEAEKAQYQAMYGTKKTIYNESYIGHVCVQHYKPSPKEKAALNIRKAAGWFIIAVMFMLSLIFVPIIAAIVTGVCFAMLAINLIEG